MASDLINERVKFTRKYLNLTQAEFGKLCGGVSKAAVSQWEHGDTEPTLDSLIPLEKKKGISSDWIKFNKGEMLIDRLAKSTVQEGYATYDPTSPEGYATTVTDNQKSDREKLVDAMERVLCSTHDHDEIERLKSVFSRIDQLNKKDFHRALSLIEAVLNNV